jgi:hypothetical protein
LRGHPRAPRPQGEHLPENRRVEGDSEAEVRREPVLGHGGTVDEAALDHVPAEQPLAATENEQQQQARPQPRTQATAQGKVREREQEQQADQASEHAVQVLVHEDHAELVEAHAAVDLLILGELLVLLERRLPGGLANRRHDAHDRSPLDHRQPALGQPRHAAEQDHGVDDQRAGQQPECQLAVVVRVIGARGEHAVERESPGVRAMIAD